MIRHQVNKIALIGDYVPRKCGIATFTRDICRSLQKSEIDCLVVAVNDVTEGYPYPSEVRFEITEQDLNTGTTEAVGDAAARIGKRVCRATVLGTTRRHTDAVRLRLLDYIDGLADLSAGSISLPEQIREQTGGQGVNVVFDVVGGSLFAPCLQCLALGGRQVAIASSPEPKVTFNLVDFYHNQSHLTGVDSIQLSFEDSGRILRSLLPYFESRDFGPQGDPVPVGFDAVLSAYRELAEDFAKAKYVFVPQ